MDNILQWFPGHASSSVVCRIGWDPLQQG
jgi:hypothetical protein